MWLPKVLILCVLLACTAPPCSTYPIFWYSPAARQSMSIQLPGEPSCVAHPTTALASSPHESPRSDSAITFAFTDPSDGNVVDALCPGGQYILTVSFNSIRLGLLTASPAIAVNFTSPVSTTDCKNRVSLGSGLLKSTVYNTTFRLSCDTQGPSVLFLVTSAGFGGDRQWRQNSITMRVASLGSAGADGGICTATSAVCPSYALSAPPLSLVSPSPHPAPSLPSPIVAPSSSCIPSPLGYQCMAKQGKVTIHWSLNTPKAPPNACTAQLASDIYLQSGGPLAAVDGTLHVAVQAEVAGYVALGFSNSPNNMAPADIALGWAGDGTATSYFRTFHVQSSWLTERNIYPPPGTPSWAYDSGVVRDAAGITTICFSRRLRDDRARASSDLRMSAGEMAAGGRRSLAAQEVTGSRLLAFIWAVSDQQGLVQHSPGNADGFWLDAASGSAAASAGRNKRYWINVHGALMAVAWGLLLPLGTMFPAHRWVRGGDKIILGQQVWFVAHLATQWTGMILFIAGVIVAFTKLEGGGSGDVKEAHGSIGIAIMAAAGAQVVLAFVRPAPPSPGETLSNLRRVWNLVHHNLGRAVVLLAWANVYIGIYVYHTSMWAASYTPWVTPIAIVMGLLVILDIVLRIVGATRKERDLTDEEFQESQSDVLKSPADVAVMLNARP